MPVYVRWTRGADFRAIRTLGLGEWRRLLAASPFESASLVCPPLPNSDLRHFGPVKQALARAYNSFVSSRIGQAWARRFGPLFHVVCTRADELPFPSSPATHRRSTPRVGPR
jgi:hypothetical protein